MALSKVIRASQFNRRSMSLGGCPLFASAQRVYGPYKPFTSTDTPEGHISPRARGAQEQESASCALDFKPPLDDGPAAWDKFRHLRDSKWSGVSEVEQSRKYYLCD